MIFNPGLMDIRNNPVYEHLHNTARVLSFLTDYFYGHDIPHLTEAAYLHDIGKVYIPLNILNKPEKLSMLEKSIIDLHPVFSVYLLKKEFRYNNDKVLKLVLMHHLYPRNQSQFLIPFEAQLLCIADIVSATCIEVRPYRKYQMSINDVKEYLMIFTWDREIVEFICSKEFKQTVYRIFEEKNDK